MATFTVCYRMVCNGSVTVEADSEEEASRKAEELSASELGREAEDVETEIVSVS